MGTRPWCMTLCAEPTEAAYTCGSIIPDAAFTQINLSTDKLCLPLLRNPDVEVARDTILESGIPLSALGVHRGDIVRFQLTLMGDNLPLDIIPQQGFIEFSTADPTE